MRRRALLLDLDGTLADSLPALRGVYSTFLSRFGVVGTESEFQALNGPPLREVCRRLQVSHQLPGDLDRLYGDYQGLVAGAHTSILPADGAEIVLSAAKEAGWTLAVVTSTPGAAAREWIAHHGLDVFIDFVVGGDEVSTGKPDPEPYRTALVRSDCSAINAIAIEDSLKGAMSALSAGVPTWLLAEHAPEAVSGHAEFRGYLQSFRLVAGLICTRT